MNGLSDISAVLDQFENVKLLCLGDVVLDRYATGEVARISQEAPIPILRLTQENLVLGGAGNAAANMAGLGAAVTTVAVTGADDTAKTLAAILQQETGNIDGLVSDATRPTTVKTRYLAARQQLLRADFESTEAITKEVEDQILKQVTAALKNCDVVVISDYAKGVITKRVAQETIAAAQKAGKPVLVDPAPHADYETYRGATLVTPNRKELSHAAGFEACDDASVIKAARTVQNTYGIKAVIATRSEDGMTVISPEHDPVHIPTAAREVFDVSGAGDTVVAAIAVALGAGASLETAATIGNIAAGIVVEKTGTAIVRYGEVLDTLLRAQKQDHLAQGEATALLMDITQIAAQAERWRRKGLKVGFTNGCFDLLHPGHISLLRQARAQCDRLIVGLNSDSSVQALKGPTRPVQDETARSTVLASLSAVDRIVIFSEETPMKLIEAIRPDVLVKGADYTVETVVGADLVQSYGGRVFLAQLEDGHSTTNTIKKLAG